MYCFGTLEMIFLTRVNLQYTPHHFNFCAGVRVLNIFEYDSFHLQSEKMFTVMLLLCVKFTPPEGNIALQCHNRDYKAHSFFDKNVSRIVLVALFKFFSQTAKKFGL